MTSMPLDNDSQPIPVLMLRPGFCKKVDFNATSDRTDSNFSADARVVQLTPTAPCYVAFGDETVVAADTDHYLAAGVPQVFSIRSPGYPVPLRVAALQVSESGTLYVSELV